MEAILFKNKVDPVTDISRWVTTETLSWDATDELTLVIPNKINNEKVLAYKEVTKNRYIVVDGARRYVIKSIEETRNSAISEKRVTAYSVECLLENINIELEENVPYFFNDICDEITKVTGWKFVLKDKLKISNCFSIAGSYKVLTLLRDTLQYLYEVHFDFDTVHNKIIVTNKTADDYTVYGDYDNLIQSVTVNDTENVITRLRNTDEQTGIFAEHITATEYVEDFSYFIDNGLISSYLIQQLEKYDKFLEKKQPDFIKLQNKLFALDSELKGVESDIEKLEQIEDISEKDTDKLAKLETRKTELEADIKTAEDAILEFGEKVSRENSGLFNNELLVELNEIIIEEDYTGNNETSSAERYTNMLKKIKQLNQPKTEYTLDIPTVNHIVAELGTGAIKLGSLFYFSSEIGIDNLRLIGYTIDYTVTEIDRGYYYTNLQFSNSWDEPVDKLDFFGQLVDEQKRTQRKTNKIKITVERLEDGIKSQVSKGDFYTAMTQTYNYIEGEVNADRVASKVVQKADEYSISINGRLKGTKYLFNGENAEFIGAGLIIKNDKGEIILYVNDDTGLLTCNSLDVENGNVNFKSPNNKKSLFVNFARGNENPARIGVYAQEPTIDRGNQLFIEPSSLDKKKTPMVIFRGRESTATANQQCVVQVIGEIQALNSLQIGFGNNAVNVGSKLTELENRIKALEN